MPAFRLERSVVTRLVASIVLGGLIVSFGLGVLELQHSQTLLGLELTQRIVQSTRALQSELRSQAHSPPSDRYRATLETYLDDPRICAARIVGPGAHTVSFKAWPAVSRDDLRMWHLPQAGLPRGSEVNFDQLTMVIAPFTVGQERVTVEFLIDGPAALAANRARVLRDVAGHWLFMAVMVLMGLLLLRRWFTGPLMSIVELIAAHSGPTSFYRLARNSHSEFAQLAEAIGGMLTRLESTTNRLRERERAFENLYQHAPSAMVSLDVSGRIVEANRRSAELLKLPTQRILIGEQVMQFVAAEDRGLLREAIGRLAMHHATRCQVRLSAGEQTIHVAVECLGVRDDDGQLRMVRLSMLDVSETTQLHRELADKSQLLNLIIDHMSDAIVLVDAKGRVAAVNQQLGAWLHCRPQAMVGMPYVPERFWDALGMVDPDQFVSRLRQIDADGNRPAQERFATRGGTFLFQTIPVQDTLGESVGKLWVVSEVTSQQQNQKLLDQQTRQLQSLRWLGRMLHQIHGVDELLERTAAWLFEMFDVEAIGLALRCDDAGRRGHQIMHRGAGPYLLETNRTMIGAIETDLMPQLFANRDVTLWPDLPRGSQWTRSFEQAGLTTVAGAPLTGGADAHGVVWIARRGGERIERHHIHLLEALVPLVAGRLDNLQLRAQMENLNLTDPATDLPNAAHFQHQLDRIAPKTRGHFATLMIGLDHFQTLVETMNPDLAAQLLRGVAVTLKRSMRKSCFVARMNDAVFGVLVPHNDRAAVLAMADRLVRVIAEQQIAMPDGHTWQLTASIGVAVSPEDGAAPGQIIARARHRMELARRSGRNRVVIDDVRSHRQVG
jgi:diguanylate cyclase (GGDEF)-like protein/PAS domain S-box-containing protein